MPDKILHKRNLTSGSIPTTSSLDVGELAINVADAKVFVKQSGSNSQAVRSLLTLDVANTGSINLFGSITASVFFGTASWAQSASVAITSSYVLPSGLPSGIVSSSTQINTGSFTGSFTGTLLGTSSWANSASIAITSSYVLPSGLPSEIVSSSTQINTGSFSGSFRGTFSGDGSQLTGIVASGVGVTIADDAVTQGNAGRLDFQNFISATVASNTASINVTLPAGTVSSSTQINTGSFTGSFTGTLIGTSSWATSASYAVNALTASYANAFSGFINFPSGVDISGSLFVTGSQTTIGNTVITGSLILSSSAAIELTVIGNTVLSGSTTATGGITGSLLGTGSWANTASISVTASYVLPSGLPSGVVSSSTQINTGSFTGSFTGALIGTSSWATSASAVISSSYSLTASYALNAGGAGTVGPGTINYIPKFTTTTTIGDSSVRDTGTYIISSLPISASSFTGSLFGTSSWATNAISASWAPISAIQSSSLTIDQYSFTSDGSTTNYVLSKSYLDTSLFVMVDGLVFNLVDDYTFNSGTSTLTLLQAPPSQSVIYVRGFMNVAPNATGSYYGVFNGTFSGSFNTTASAAVSSSYALTASYALNAGGGSGTVTSITAGDGLSGGIITTAGTISLNTSSLHFTDGVKKKLNTDGVISSSLQINTGSFSGSFNGSFSGTSSYGTNALSSSYALTASYALNSGGGGSISTTTITRTLTLSSGYASILSASENVLTDGAYMVSSVLNDGTFSNYRLSGTFSWYSGSYSTSEYDEIFLHRMGRSPSSASVFMRTRTVSGSNGYLEIGCDYTLSPSSYTFTFARII